MSTKKTKFPDPIKQQKVNNADKFFPKVQENAQLIPEQQALARQKIQQALSRSQPNKTYGVPISNSKPQVTPGIQQVLDQPPKQIKQPPPPKSIPKTQNYNVSEQTNLPSIPTTSSPAIEIQSGNGLGSKTNQKLQPSDQTATVSPQQNSNRIKFLKRINQLPYQYRNDPNYTTNSNPSPSAPQFQQNAQDPKIATGYPAYFPRQKQNLQQNISLENNTSQQQPQTFPNLGPTSNFRQKMLNQFQTLNNRQIIDIILVYVIKVFSLIFFYVSQYYVYQLFVSRIVKAKASADSLPDLSVYIRYSIVALTILQITPLIIILTIVYRGKQFSSNAQGTIIKVIGDVFLTNFILYFFGQTFVQIILSKSNNNYQDQPSYAIQELSSLLKSSFLCIVFLPYFSVFYLLNSLRK